MSELHCAGCGVLVSKTLARVKAASMGREVWCGRPCRDRTYATRQRRRSRERYLEQAEQRPCSFCGVMFTPTREQMGHVRAGNAAYHSKECSSAAEVARRRGNSQEYREAQHCANPFCAVRGELPETELQPSGYCLLCEHEQARGWRISA